MSPEPTDEPVGRALHDAEPGEPVEVAMSDTPAYVHVIMDSLLRRIPVDLDAVDMPADVRARFDSYIEARRVLVGERGFAEGPAYVYLEQAIADAVRSEFSTSFGLAMGANQDDTWIKVGGGLVWKMGARHVGWMAPGEPDSFRIGDMAHPDSYVPVFIFV